MDINNIKKIDKKYFFLLGILGILILIYFFWEGAQQATVLPENSSVQRETAKPEEGEAAGTGELVCGVQSALRYRPLPDLFAAGTAEKKKETSAPAATTAAPVATTAGKKEVAASEAAPVKVSEPALPIVRGAVHQGQQHLVLLEYEKKIQPYAAGEYCGGWRIAYVNPQAVGLERETQILELAL